MWKHTPSVLLIGSTDRLSDLLAEASIAHHSERSGLSGMCHVFNTATKRDYYDVILISDVLADIDGMAVARALRTVGESNGLIARSKIILVQRLPLLSSWLIEPGLVDITLREEDGPEKALHSIRNVLNHSKLERMVESMPTVRGPGS